MWGSYQLQIFSARDLWAWRRQGDLVCVEWDTKPQLNQLINQSITVRPWLPHFMQPCSTLCISGSVNDVTFSHNG